MKWSRRRTWAAAAVGLVGILLPAGIAGAGLAGLTKASLPAKTAHDVKVFVAEENAVLSQLKAFGKLSAGSSVTKWESKLKAAEAAQAAGETALGADLTPAVPVTTTSAPSSASGEGLNASGLLAGSASPAPIPAGTPGKVTVVVVGQVNNSETSGGAHVPVIIRNDTSAAVGDIVVTGQALDSTGNVASTVSSDGTWPSVLQPGQAALAYVHSSVGTLPTGGTFKFTVQSSSDLSSVNLRIVQSSISPSSLPTNATITGEAINPSSSLVTSANVGVFCFSSSGALIGDAEGQLGQSTISPGTTANFSVETFMSCPTYLVGANGTPG